MSDPDGYFEHCTMRTSTERIAPEYGTSNRGAVDAGGHATSFFLRRN